MDPWEKYLHVRMRLVSPIPLNETLIFKKNITLIRFYSELIAKV